MLLLGGILAVHRTARTTHSLSLVLASFTLALEIGHCANQPTWFEAMENREECVVSVANNAGPYSLWPTTVAAAFAN